MAKVFVAGLSNSAIEELPPKAQPLSAWQEINPWYFSAAGLVGDWDWPEPTTIVRKPMIDPSTCATHTLCIGPPQQFCK